jgi:hypothetical protein
MKTSTIAFWMTLLSCAVPMATTGCSGADADASVETDEDEGAVALKLFDNVVAAKDGDNTIAAPAKMKTLLKSIKSPKEGALRCLPMKVVTLLDAAGKTAGTLSLFCSPAGTATTVEGTVDLAGTKTTYIVKVNVKALKGVLDAPLAVGDYLYGADRVTISHDLAPPIELASPELVQQAADAIGLDQAPDPAADAFRCIPDYSLDFFKGKKKVASAISYGDCNKGAVVPGRFFIGPKTEVAGGIEVDTRKLEPLMTAKATK